MKNWRTTIVGAIIGGLIAIQPVLETGTYSVKELVLGFLFAALGLLAKDYNISGTK